MGRLAVRLFLIANLGLNYLAYATTGHATAENAATSAILAAFLCPVALLPFAVMRLAFRPKQPGTGLDRVLFRFPTGDAFYLRHLLTSICIFGIIGAGKSSSSGLFLARMVLRIHSGGLILASNPDDLKWWTARFREAGRPGDLIVFSPNSKERWNFLAVLQKGGADARALTQFLVVASETLVESKGKDDVYWKQLSERMLFNVISGLMMAGYGVSAGAISNFLATAAFSPQQLLADDYRKGFCNEVLLKAEANAVTPLQEGDYAMLANYWRGSFLYLDDRPRSSALSAVENIMHSLSVGYAREIFSTGTTTSCEDLKSGKWILMDFPVSAGGATSKIIYSCAKLAVQKMVLKNNWTPDQPVNIIWSDECWHVVNSGDRDFLAESRKHGGVLIYLTQSILNFYISMGDESGKARAESLLGMMGTLVVHAADVATARYVVELIGEAEREEYGNTYAPAAELEDRIGGSSQWTGSVNERRMPIMTGRQLTAGMRMGGKSKVVDAWVYRPELFRDGTNIQRMEFRQD